MGYNRQASLEKWSKKDDADAAVDEIEAAFALPTGPGPLAGAKKSFWEKFKDHVEENKLKSALHVYESERGIFPDVGLSDTENAFEFMRLMGEVPEWAHDYCFDHVMIKKEEDPERMFAGAVISLTEDEDDEEYKCENCWMKAKR